MTLSLQPISICTNLGTRIPGFSKPPSAFEERWDDVKDFACDIQELRSPYVRKVRCFTIAPEALSFMQETIKKTPAPPKQEGEGEPIYAVCWDRLNGTGLRRIFVNHLAGKVHMIALESDLFNGCRHALNRTAEHLGLQHRPIRRDFTIEDLAALRLTPQAVFMLREMLPLYPHTLPCFSYALLSAGDPHAIQCLFDFREDVGTIGGEAALTKTLFKRLKEAYEPVSSFKPGDLVLYLKDGVPKHMAYCREEGLLESKFGISPDVYIHKVDQAGAEHANQVIFYRKRPERAPA